MSAKKSKSCCKKRRKLRDRALKELDRLEGIRKEKGTFALIASFLGKFVACESVYKILLKDWKPMDEREPRLILNQVKPVMEYAGYSYNEALMKKLFGSDSKVGERSAKKLRDALAHNMSNSAIEELRGRRNEIFGSMDRFLNMVRNFDKGEKR